MGDHAGRLGAQSMGAARSRATRTAYKAALRGFAAPAASIVRSNRRWGSPLSRRLAAPLRRREFDIPRQYDKSELDRGSRARRPRRRNHRSQGFYRPIPTPPRPSVPPDDRCVPAPPSRQRRFIAATRAYFNMDTPSCSRYPREQPRTSFAEQWEQPRSCCPYRNRATSRKLDARPRVRPARAFRGSPGCRRAADHVVSSGILPETAGRRCSS